LRQGYLDPFHQQIFLPGALRADLPFEEELRPRFVRCLQADGRRGSRALPLLRSLAGRRRISIADDEDVPCHSEREKLTSVSAGGTISLEGRAHGYEVRRVSPTEFSVMAGGRQVRVVASSGEERFDVIAGEFRGRVSVESERQRLLRRYARSTGVSSARLEVHAPMPAMVLKLE